MMRRTAVGTSGDPNGREELSLEGDPVERFGQCFATLPRFAQLVRIIIRPFVGKGGIALLEAVAFFQVADLLFPAGMDRLLCGGEEILQSPGLNAKVHLGKKS